MITQHRRDLTTQKWDIENKMRFDRGHKLKRIKLTRQLEEVKARLLFLDQLQSSKERYRMGTSLEHTLSGLDDFQDSVNYLFTCRPDFNAAKVQKVKEKIIELQLALKELES